MNAVITADPIASAPRRSPAELEPASPSTPTINLPVGYLRACLTVMVLAHHAVLAYIPHIPPPSASILDEPRLWQAFPVVDSQRWTGFGLFVGFNDTFFMSLMFLLSGLFVWKSLQRKGSKAFLRDRMFRLGVPFLVVAAFVAPLAYYPAYLMTAAHPNLAEFARQWLSLGSWPAGPLWFIWVLLAFDCLAVLLFMAIPKWGESLGRLLSGALHRPIAFYGLLVTASAAAYIPLVWAFNPFSWSAFGPFAFQTSRILLYACYFLAGIGIGAYSLERSRIQANQQTNALLAPDGKLARRWVGWVLAALAAFAVAVIITIAAFASPGPSHKWETLGGLAFVLSCAASSFAALALFLRFARTRVKIFDSLRDNAYGMYLIHYPFASWLPYALLRAPLPAFAKGSLAFAGTLALSWAAVSALRRIPAVARVI
jgi:peptidoglycan/LPS O-acetylase OafA/YrhL